MSVLSHLVGSAMPSVAELTVMTIHPDGSIQEITETDNNQITILFGLDFDTVVRHTIL